MRLLRTLQLTALLVLAAPVLVRAESKYVFGLHFWDWGANVKVMNHRTGWVVEANTTSGESQPNVGGRYRPACGEGFTIMQRLDWKWEQTIPTNEADMDTFARQCRDNWAARIKNYCRHYSIGNEVEFFVHDNLPEVYARCFTKVRNAIKQVQPDAIVTIGHMNNDQNQKRVMQILGPDGYDGVTAHVGSHVPTNLLDILDQVNARPGVGVYITEWGWVAGTNANAMGVMRSFYEDIGESNRSRDRQVYCACWFVYPEGIGWNTFAMEISPIDANAFAAANALGTTMNSYGDNPVVMSVMYADIPENGRSIQCTWRTNVPARTQLWWMPDGYESGYSTDLGSHVYNHSVTLTEVVPNRVYQIMPLAKARDYGDAGGRRYRVQTGPWPSQAQQVVGKGQTMRVTWDTQFPADSRVAYGRTSSLGEWAMDSMPVTSHAVEIPNLDTGAYYYRVVSADENPDGEALKMRSSLRQFIVTPATPGDFDDDGDVDMSDFGHFQACYTGPGIAQNDANCASARLDIDEDVDTTDLVIFQGCLAGSDVTPDPDCAG